MQRGYSRQRLPRDAPHAVLLRVRQAAAAMAVALCLIPAACNKDQQMTTESTNRSKHALNRLQHATSPYLQQHAHNPVDWFEWGQEAIDKARRENKPIFLSIGYSACHWCHVMAHESFEDPAIANVMNRLFVNVKVDREERPDIDDIYMQATLVYTRGQGGWPMSVWLTPELKPFFAGTYFPPTQRYGRPGFREICERIGDLWAGDRAALESDANRITEHLSGQSTSSQPTLIALTPDVIDRTADLLAGAFDARKGGLLSGGTNKFPPSMALELMMRSAARRNEDDAARRQLMDRVTVTLDRMANGGIHDQLAGGFHRYSTDADWLAPHFEKMLYDQALISRAYVEAYLLTGDSRYARVARGVFEYVLEDLCSPDGAFYSTRDADSEGEEGRYYVWTREQIARALPAAELDAFCDYYGVTEAGNWDDPHTPGAPKNILHVAQPSTDDNEANRFRGARAALLKAREQRIPPHRDEKVLCEWNGLMIASLARGGAAMNESRYVHAASRAADSILRRQYRDGRLMRSYRDGRTLDMAFLTDYACMIDGLIELHQATQDARWLETARRLDEVLTAQFWDEGRGGYFSTAANHEALILRPKDFRDGATPSGNSVQLGNLLRLAVLFDDAGCRERATQTIDAFAGELLQAPGACERFLASADMALHGSVEIVIVGDAGDARTHALERTVYEQYLPNRLLLRVNPNNGDISAASPLVAGRKMVDGAPAAYVCRNYACRSPVTTPAALASQLREFGRGR